MIELPSNIVEGLALLPQGLKYPDDISWLSIYLARKDANQDTLVQLWNWLLAWPIPGADTPTFILDWIGRLLGQPRPDGADNETYRLVLLVRRIVRVSSGTRPDVRSVVKALGDLGTGARVDFLVPHTVIVTFANFADLDELGLPADLVGGLILDAIGDVDRLQLWDAVGNAFAWNVPGAGWSQGIWTTAIFDSKDLP